MSFSRICNLYGVSRKSGYKWWKRYLEQGIEGLQGRSSRPKGCQHQTTDLWRDLILKTRLKHRWWGPKKIRKVLIDKYGNGCPAASTIGRILHQEGLIKTRRRRKYGTKLGRSRVGTSNGPNDVWAADFKGWFRTGDGQRCDPLTISDLASRYVLCCSAAPDQTVEHAMKIFEAIFTQYGLPNKIRVDNGSPFGSRGAAGLSQLSVWWLRLGIEPEYIDPGHPEQNGCHERMHRTLKAETTHPPAANRQAQQRKFNAFKETFNELRPHEALGQQTPASLYTLSSRQYHGVVGPIKYQDQYAVRRVRGQGTIKWKGRLRFIGMPFKGQSVGIQSVEEGHDQVWFMDRLLGDLYDQDPTGIRPVKMERCKPSHKKGKYPSNA